MPSPGNCASRIDRKRFVGIEDARFAGGQLLRLQLPGAGLVFAPGHPEEIQGGEFAILRANAQEPRVAQPERMIGCIAEGHPLPKDGGAGINDIALGHDDRSVAQGQVQLQFPLFEGLLSVAHERPAAAPAAPALRLLAHRHKELIRFAVRRHPLETAGLVLEALHAELPAFEGDHPFHDRSSQGPAGLLPRDGGIPAHRPQRAGGQPEQSAAEGQAAIPQSSGGRPQNLRGGEMRVDERSALRNGFSHGAIYAQTPGSGDRFSAESPRYLLRRSLRAFR